MKLIRQDDEYDENKLLYWVICNVLSLFKFNQFECVSYKQMLVWFI